MQTRTMVIGTGFRWWRWGNVEIQDDGRRGTARTVADAFMLGHKKVRGNVGAFITRK